MSSLKVRHTPHYRQLLNQAEASEELSAETEHLYKSALNLAITAVGSVHPDVGEASTYLGDYLMHAERFDEAEKLYRQALHVYQSRYGQDHMLVSMALRNLAEAIHSSGSPEEAKIIRSKARSIFG